MAEQKQTNLKPITDQLSKLNENIQKIVNQNKDNFEKLVKQSNDSLQKFINDAMAKFKNLKIEDSIKDFTKKIEDFVGQFKGLKLDDTFKMMKDKFDEFMGNIKDFKIEEAMNFKNWSGLVEKSFKSMSDYAKTYNNMIKDLFQKFSIKGQKKTNNK